MLFQLNLASQFVGDARVSLRVSEDHDDGEPNSTNGATMSDDGVASSSRGDDDGGDRDVIGQPNDGLWAMPRSQVDDGG